MFLPEFGQDSRKLAVIYFKLAGDRISAAVLNQTNTVFVVILAAVFLKDRLTHRRLLATVLAVACALLVLLG